MKKRISPAAIHALNEALSQVFWYKTDLRSFLSHCIADSGIISKINWSEYKRNIVSTLIEYLSTNEDVYQRDLIRLMSEVCQITDFSHLRKLDEGVEKANQA
jgi:hypothetical protein